MVTTQAPVFSVSEIHAHNRRAWNWSVEQANRWTVPVSSDEIAAARRGDLRLHLLRADERVPVEVPAPLGVLLVLELVDGDLVVGHPRFNAFGRCEQVDLVREDKCTGQVGVELVECGSKGPPPPPRRRALFHTVMTARGVPRHSRGFPRNPVADHAH